MKVPEFPFQYIATDYFQEGSSHYFVFVCRYSNWLSVYQAKRGGSKELVSQLRAYMSTFGVMDELGEPSNWICRKIWSFVPTRSTPTPLPVSWDTQN